MRGGVQDTLLDRLTPRQREILELVAKGLTNDDIASVLSLAHGTVRTHVSSVLRILQVANRTEAAAVLLASERGEDAVFGRPAVAVLPFDTRIRDPKVRILATAIPDDLIRLLSRWAWFPVIARSSSLDSTRVVGGARDIGQSLGARYLISGRIQQLERSVTLHVHLEDAEREATLSAERYEVGLLELFDTHQEIIEAVVARLYPRLIAAVSIASDLVGRKVAAWQLAARGTVELARRSRASNTRARELFGRAVRADEELALAHFGRGLALYQDLLNSWDVDATTLPALASSSSRCSELAPTRAESRFLRARLEMASGDFGAAVPHLHEATRLNPSFAEDYAALAQARLVAEDNDAALALMERAARLSPHAYVAGLACAQFSIHHYADALRSAQRALETHPGYTFARTVACASAAELGDQALARKLLARIRRDVPGFTVDYLRAAFANQRFAAVDRFVEAVSRLR